MGRTRAVLAALAVAAPVLGLEAGAFCFEEAGRMYRVAPGLLAVVAEHESRFDPAARNQNPDGTYDIGLMQINSSWEKTLGPERWAAVCTNPCYNVKVGAWILADCLERLGYSWEGLGCYNAASREKRATYAAALIQKMWRALEEKKRAKRD